MDYLDDKMNKKIMRLKKELDLTSIQKLLKSKSDDTEVKKEFENVDFKVKCMNDTMNGVKKDLDGMYGSLRKISDIISILQQEQATALASTKNAMCLSCGRGDANFLPPMQQVPPPLTLDPRPRRQLLPIAHKGQPKAWKSEEQRSLQLRYKNRLMFSGYDVFNTNQIVHDHERIQHNPSDNFYLSKNQRPKSGALGNSHVSNIKNLKSSKQTTSDKK
jgi:hypothetical protein